MHTVIYVPIKPNADREIVTTNILNMSTLAYLPEPAIQKLPYAINFLMMAKSLNNAASKTTFYCFLIYIFHQKNKEKPCFDIHCLWQNNRLIY